MVVYLTHCSAKKDASLRHSGRKVPPDELYTATPTRRFMERCKEKKVRWAIFSDFYGVWFPEIRHGWYEKDPDAVTQSEFSTLLQDFGQKLASYNQIRFYHNPGRFHPLYARLLQQTALKGKVTLITHLWDIL